MKYLITMLTANGQVIEKTEDDISEAGMETLLENFRILLSTRHPIIIKLEDNYIVAHPDNLIVSVSKIVT